MRTQTPVCPPQVFPLLLFKFCLSLRFRVILWYLVSGFQQSALFVKLFIYLLYNNVIYSCDILTYQVACYFFYKELKLAYFCFDATDGFAALPDAANCVYLVYLCGCLATTVCINPPPPFTVQSFSFVLLPPHTDYRKSNIATELLTTRTDRWAKLGPPCIIHRTWRPTLTMRRKWDIIMEIPCLLKIR